MCCKWHFGTTACCHNSPPTPWHGHSCHGSTRYAPGRVPCLQDVSRADSRVCAACLTLNLGKFLSGIIFTYNYNFIGRENHGANLRGNCRVRGGDTRDWCFCTMICLSFNLREIIESMCKEFLLFFSKISLLFSSLYKVWTDATDRDD